MVSQQVVDLHLSHLPGVASIVVEDERTVADVRSFVGESKVLPARSALLLMLHSVA